MKFSIEITTRMEPVGIHSATTTEINETINDSTMDSQPSPTQSKKDEFPLLYVGAGLLILMVVIYLVRRFKSGGEE